MFEHEGGPTFFRNNNVRAGDPETSFFAIQIASRGTLESLPDHSVLHVLEKLLEKRGTLDILDHSVLHVFEEVLEKKEES